MIPSKKDSDNVKRSACCRHISAAAVRAGDLTDPPEAPPEVGEVAKRLARIGPRKAVQIRRLNMERIRFLAIELRAESLELRGKAPPTVASVLAASGPGGAHVALLRELLREIGFQDGDALIQDLLRGFPLVGDIPISSSAREELVRDFEVDAADASVAARSAEHRFSTGQGGTAPGSDQQEIFRQTTEEVKVGRMSGLRDPTFGGPSPQTRRFGVEQMSSDGRTKLRCIDDFAESLVNGMCRIGRRIRMGRVSDALASARILAAAWPSEDVLLCKSDFKAAYRGCPIRSEHLDFARIVLEDPESGKTREATQWAMPFGAVAAVYAWDRVGEAITAIVSELLLIPLSRYVDDIFGPLFGTGAREARSLMVELVSLLGFVLEESKTPQPASEQVILGTNLSIGRKVRRGQASFSAEIRVDERKAELWLGIIREALRTGWE